LCSLQALMMRRCFLLPDSLYQKHDAVWYTYGLEVSDGTLCKIMEAGSEALVQ
jgi:hypothetical protein